MRSSQSLPQGLSHWQAAQQLLRDGPNALPTGTRRTFRHIAFEVVREPMFALLLAAGAIYLVLGSRNDALMLLGFVFFTLAITIVQSRKSEKVLEALRDLSSPRALVIRSGEQVRVAGRDVVQGDLLVLEEGDRVAADGIVLECHDLLVDESLLTGESVAVAKIAAAPHDVAAQRDEHQDRIYSGSMVVQGGGLARVTSIGTATEIGKIGRSLQARQTERSPLQQEIGTLVKRFAILGAALSILVVVLSGVTVGGWFQGLLAGITLAMSILPEEFQVILTVFMALGAWRISRNHVLTRHTPVIETLGSATVLCVDKTGTLTENRMSVKALVIGEQRLVIPGGRSDALSAQAAELLEVAVLASEKAPFDPMEKAIHRCADDFLSADRAQHDDWLFVHEYPLTSDIMAMTHAWRAPGASDHVVATKGAPETVARLCRLDARRTAGILVQVERLAAEGMRVLAVARARNAGDSWPLSPEAFDFAWLGLVGLADPIRPTVRTAVGECQQAGIRVVMITGDFPVTAQAIAKEAGLPYRKTLTGVQLEALSGAGIRAVVREVSVFARIRPEQKLRLVNAFKANGEIVAMTGDGINDAPALKAAHIGIGMGARGTDVAREAASLVLLNDDFSAIVQAVRLGRKIYDNLRKAMTYIVAVHLPIAGMVLLPLLTGMPIAFAPIHIVFLEMIINPACSIVFEAEREEGDIMRRPPRRAAERLFGVRNVAVAVLQGAGLLLAVAAVFAASLHQGLSAAEARAAAFATLVAGNLALIVVNRSMMHGAVALLRMPNPAQWWILCGGGAALLLVLYLPWLQRAFQFSPLRAGHLAASMAACAIAIAWFELVKYGFRTRGGARLPDGMAHRASIGVDR